MKDTELMVGNIFLDKNLNAICAIDWSDLKYPHNLEPVVFDDKWCRSMPFVVCEGAEEFGVWEMLYVDRLGVLKIFRVVLCEGGGAYVIIEDQCNKTGINLGEYKYVHEIQQLFFSLACRPLEVNTNNGK